MNAVVLGANISLLVVKGKPAAALVDAALFCENDKLADNPVFFAVNFENVAVADFGRLGRLLRDGHKSYSAQPFRDHHIWTPVLAHVHLSVCRAEPVDRIKRHGVGVVGDLAVVHHTHASRNLLGRRVHFVKGGSCFVDFDVVCLHFNGCSDQSD